MPRRREPSILELALAGRWHLSFALAVASLVLGEWLIPAIISSTVLWRPLATTIQTFAWIPVVGFGVIALVKWIQEARGETASSSTGSRLEPAARDARSRSEFTISSQDPTAARIEPIIDVTESRRVQSAAWSLDLLQSIDWKRFEEIVAAYFREKNFRCETLAAGPDGGIDGRLYFGKLPAPVAVIQCKAWKQQVGVAPVRELLGVMTHEKVARGYFCTTGSFTTEAIAFAKPNPIMLIDGQDFLDAMSRMPIDAQRRLLESCTAGDYTTPTCPSCGIKLVKRAIGGKHAWACENFPRCRVKIWIRTDDAPR